MKNVSERKTVLLAERDIQPIVSSRGLQLEIERAAKTLAQRQPPGFVDARAKWGVDDQLHAAALVEKAFGDDGGLRGNSAEHRASSDDVFDGLDILERVLQDMYSEHPKELTKTVRRINKRKGPRRAGRQKG